MKTMCEQSKAPNKREQPVERLALSVTEAAEALGISRRSMYDLMHREGFPSLRVGGRRLISKELLAAWVRDQARGQ